MNTVEGVTITPPAPVIPPIHAPGHYQFSSLEGERTVQQCSCGTLFEFYGPYRLGKDTTRLALAQHIYEENIKIDKMAG